MIAKVCPTAKMKNVFEGFEVLRLKIPNMVDGQDGRLKFNAFDK